MACVSIVSYSIFINDKHFVPFAAKRGMRQGDPLSTYLFVLVMEYLRRRLKSLKDKPDFNFHPRCAKLNIIQLGFVDDLLLFCRGDVLSTQTVFECFQKFSMASGMVASQGKSSINFDGVPANVQLEITQLLGFPTGTLPLRYLGVPLSSKRLSISSVNH
ncbi:PREDICTED: uncharacterized protein LOC109219667 [Nicotiana attenuata]|uniref:uncharacterized protein LOC109219667 n=1 Tax=Nicotiana attenuata TaxID=49451 RepID=UPI0009057679|nr:PREDICTED: uncharacterized protein LOC109219667 [Nicotiana attenuata]